MAERDSELMCEKEVLGAIEAPTTADAENRVRSAASDEVADVQPLQRSYRTGGCRFLEADTSPHFAGANFSDSLAQSTSR